MNAHDAAAGRWPGGFGALAPLYSDTARFWEAIQAGHLVLPRCDRCRRLIAYPREHCPRCGWEQVTWEEVDGRGVVFTYTVIHQSRATEWHERTPYVAAVVELEPGARLPTLIVGCEPQAVHVGMPVELVIQEREDGIRVPGFRPVEPSDAD